MTHDLVAIKELWVYDNALPYNILKLNGSALADVGLPYTVNIVDVLDTTPAVVKSVVLSPSVLTLNGNSSQYFPVRYVSRLTNLLLD